MMEKAYKYLVDEASLRAAIDAAKSVAKITQSINPSDIADYSFLRAAVKAKQSLAELGLMEFTVPLPAPAKNQKSAPAPLLP